MLDVAKFIWVNGESVWQHNPNSPVASKCMDFCQAMASQGHFLTFSSNFPVNKSLSKQGNAWRGEEFNAKKQKNSSGVLLPVFGNQISKMKLVPLGFWYHSKGVEVELVLMTHLPLFCSLLTGSFC